MNSKFLHEQTRAVAERVMARGDENPQRVEWAYRMIFGRAPTSEESARAEEFFEETAGGQTSWASYVRGMLASNEFFFVD